jgi:hypothetical protein
VLPEVPRVDDALDQLRRDALAVSSARTGLWSASHLPTYPEELEALVAARDASMLAAAAAGASIGQMAHVLQARSGTRTRQMLDRAPLPDSARQETLHEWGVALRRRRSDGNLNRGQLAVLAVMSRADVVALEDGQRMPSPEQVELLRAALSMSQQNRTARLRVIREQQVGPRPLPRTGGPRRGPLSDAQQERLVELRQMLEVLRPLLEERDDLLASAQESGIPMSRIAAETGLSPADVRRSIDAVQRRGAST